MSDFIESEAHIPLADLGTNTTLYIEGIEGNASGDSITVRLYDHEHMLLAQDIVRVLIFDPALGLPQSTEIEGFNIVHNSGTGTAGNDIIFAPLGTSEINAFAGDDIIVALPGDQTIYAGAGEDVVFTEWPGQKTIYLDDPIESAARDVRQVGPQRIERRTEKPFTVDQVRRVYALMYGENDPWLPLFEQFGGRIEAVEGDGVPFSESDWDCITHPESGALRPVIQLQFSLGSPILAATHLRQQMLDACARSALGRCDLGYQIESALVELLFESAQSQEHATFEDAVMQYAELRTLAFQNAVAATAAISNVYISSVGIFSEGADLILTVGDIADGNYTSAIGLLPFVSAPMVSGAKAAIRTASGARIVEKTGEVIRHYPCPLRASCGLGWIKRPNMPLRFRTPPGGGPAVPIHGTGQWTSGDNGAAHAVKCESVANELADLGDFDYLLMNRSLRTCTGLDTLGSFTGKRPDVFGVRRGTDGNPIIFIREIQSPSQTPDQVRAYLAEIKQALEARGFTVDDLPIFLPY